MLTAVPGSSDYFNGGIVAYHNSIKSNILGVPAKMLARGGPGAVSSPCACAMADGTRRKLGVDISASITGIAGPKGGSPNKPVGTTYIGIARKGKKTKAFRFLFAGDRRQIRNRAAQTALILLWRLL